MALVIMGGVLPNVMMLRTSLPATKSIVKKSLLDCPRAENKPAALERFEGKRGANDVQAVAR